MPTFSPREYQGPDSEKVWNELISDDLETAKTLVKNHPRNSIIMSAAAVEKCIKKYMFLHDQLKQSSSTHNTKKLAADASIYDRAPKQIQETFTMLSWVHTPMSYPNTYAEFIAGNSTKAARIVYTRAEQSISWIGGLIDGERESIGSDARQRD